MDLRKTISTQLPLLSNPNQFMPPEGDKPVFYSKTGALLLAQRETYGGMDVYSAATLAAARSSTARIITGPYISGAITLDPAMLAPDIFLLNPNPAGNITWTMPTATAVVTYLKQLLGTENVVSNFCWKIHLVNGGAGIITFNLAFTGISVVGGDGGNGLLAAYGARDMVFVLTSVVPGGEAIIVYLA